MKNNYEDTDIQKSEDRIRILNKIEAFEKAGTFDIDAEDDPETYTLMPNQIDYLRAKPINKVKRAIAFVGAKMFLNKIIKNGDLIIKEIHGLENLKNLKSGAIITCNHFNPFDCFTVEKVFRMAKKGQGKKMYKVIREGNYTNFPGLYGFFFKNCDTLPLSSNTDTMKKFLNAVDTILQRGDYILIYPEQSLWWNYRKPKPLKPGAFKFAAKNNVPVVPIFITMNDSNKIGEDGFPIQEYIVNIENPIYPKEDLNVKQNTNFMMEKNYKIWKDVYEKFYGIPLEYTCDKN